MKSCPNCRLSFDDNTYNFCLEDGSLLIDLEESEVETVISYKNFNPNSISFTTTVTEPVVAINIAQQFPYVRNSAELYQVTRGLWRLSKQRAEKAKYAFAVFRGEIKEVYEIHYWESAQFDKIQFWVERKKEQGVTISPEVNKGRFQFVGQVAPENIRKQYVGKQMPVAHSQNPIRYFNC